MLAANPSCHLLANLYLPWCLGESILLGCLGWSSLEIYGCVQRGHTVQIVCVKIDEAED